MDIDEVNQCTTDGCMITVSGKGVSLFDPEPGCIDINDIAHHLANICRWSGATGDFFSVAQHTVMGLAICERERRPQWLLHDAEEAYFGDVIPPVKNQFPELNAAMINMRKFIYKELGVEYIYDAEIKRVDGEMLKWDLDHLIGKNFRHAKCWSPSEARSEFLHQYFMYC